MKAIKRFILKTLIPYLKEAIDIEHKLSYDDGKVTASLTIELFDKVIYTGSKELDV